MKKTKLESANLDNLKERGFKPNAVSGIGKFNALHIGHMEIVKDIVHTAAKLGVQSALIIFDPSPDEYFSRDYDAKDKAIMLASKAQRNKILENMGLDFVIIIPFDEKLSKMSPEEFVKSIIVDKLKLSYLITGDDFRFGHKRAGGMEDMEFFAKKYNFNYVPFGPVPGRNGEKCSSTDIRTLLLNSKIKEAEKFLGRKFTIAGKVQKGKQLAGPLLGYPTANVDTGLYAPLKKGVYHALAEVDGVKYHAACNFGVKPTFEGDEPKPLLEVHILDFNKDIYGKDISVEFCEFIREEMKFSSPDDLKAQIKIDLAQIRDLIEKDKKEKYNIKKKPEGVLER